MFQLSFWPLLCGPENHMVWIWNLPGSPWPQWGLLGIKNELLRHKVACCSGLRDFPGEAA